MKRTLILKTLKSKNGNWTEFLGISLGYSTKALVWNRQDIAEILGKSVEQYENEKAQRIAKCQNTGTPEETVIVEIKKEA